MTLSSTMAFSLARSGVRVSRSRRSIAFVSSINTRRHGFQSTSRISQDTATARSLLALDMARVPLEEGDAVRVTVDGTVVRGTVVEKRGAGWYAVQVADTTIKCRGNSLELVTDETNEKSRNLGSSPALGNSTVSSPPKIINLDQAMKQLQNGTVIENKREREFLEQCAHHASFKKWVLFSDLHVAPSSLPTCLEVLDRVHAVAKERNAGVLFLGDWWHHRGTIRVDCLNAILASLQNWQVPLILIPGNHDQVTLGLSHNHALTPLENAYRINQHAGPLVFSHPTKFQNAMFLPHIRDLRTLESVLKSKECCCESVALFVHADVTGASMNDLIVSKGGVSPSRFPSSVPIYSGHFHKPHKVKKGRVEIQYIGSPYQTSLSEAQQAKFLWVVDADRNWTCIEQVPLNIGRRHFRITSLELLMELKSEDRNITESTLHNVTNLVRQGDRVVVSIDKETLDGIRRNFTNKNEGQDGPFDVQIQKLRKQGATVEVREIKSVPVEPMGVGNSADNSNLEEMTPQATITSFLASQVSRNALSSTMAEPLLKEALQILTELESSDETAVFSSSLTRNDTELCLESVTLQGFGPFKESVTYPLHNRGLVLLRGVNKDGGSDSNGSGKSSLAMAALWALTGSNDPRPLQDSKVSDVVNDHCKSARVSVRGTLNGEYFVITRTKTSNRGGLSFHLGGKDLTTQSAKETQMVIDEKLGVQAQVLARTIFHGQHAMNGLLEASDAKLKEELSLIVPLSLWQEAASLARSKSRFASKQASELMGMVALRKMDIEDLRKRRDAANALAVEKRSAYTEAESRVEAQRVKLTMPPSGMDRNGYSLTDFQNALDESNAQVKEIESCLESLREDRDSQFPSLEAEIDDIKQETALAREQLQRKQRELDRAELECESAKRSLDALERKWGMRIQRDGYADFVPPDTCPTCLQPISRSGEGHSHSDLQKAVENEVNVVVRTVNEAEAAVNKAVNARTEAQDALTSKEKQMESAKLALERFLSNWDSRISNVENDLVAARNVQSRCSTQLSDAAQLMQQTADIKALNVSLAAELDVVRSAEGIYIELYNNVMEAETTLKDLAERSEVQQNLSDAMSSLADVFGPRGVQTFVLQNAINALQSTTQAYLDELSDGSQKMQLALDSGDRISRTAFVSDPDGSFSERPLSSLSGGQWRRCSLAMSLGFADLVARRGRMRPSLCVLDEPLTHLDRSGRAHVGKLLRSLLRRDVGGIGALESSGMAVSTIIIILQDLAAEELEESFDLIDEVVKKDGLSTVTVDEQP